jgi:hypothetical protein
MEKHAAYCAMIRLGLKVPETWLVPFKEPPDNPRFPYTAAKYNRPFDLGEVAAKVGYPLYMKPYDGGAWVGVTRIKDQGDLQRAYDQSGQRLMHLQASVEGFDVFARSLSIGAETMVMRFAPDRPQHDRYSVSHDFLDAATGDEVVTIGKVVNAFFKWEFNSCETLVRGGQVHPIDYANACPDVSLTSLHYYFPWAMTSLVKWSLFCTAYDPPLVRRRRRGRVVRGEAGRLPADGRRLLRGRPLRGVRGDPAGRSRRRGARLLLLCRLRPAAGRDGAVDVPGARARAVRRALPRAAACLGGGRGARGLTGRRGA